VSSETQLIEDLVERDVQFPARVTVPFLRNLLVTSSGHELGPQSGADNQGVVQMIKRHQVCVVLLVFISACNIDNPDADEVVGDAGVGSQDSSTDSSDQWGSDDGAVSHREEPTESDAAEDDDVTPDPTRPEDGSIPDDTEFCDGCYCPEGDKCDFVCESEPCNFYCAFDAECEVECQGFSECTLTCEESHACELQNCGDNSADRCRVNAGTYDTLTAFFFCDGGYCDSIREE
jgi:hypothetical protein